MLSLFKSTRCQRCYTERFLRECPRKDKKTCWHCCNELRCDGKCPETCAYTPKKVEGSPFPSFKADSRNESEHAIKLYIDLWIGRQNLSLDLRTPLSLASENPKQMLSWLSGFKYPGNFPLEYLMHKLGLEHETIIPEADPETAVEAYLGCLIKLEWDNLRQWTINGSKLPDLSERYAELLKQIAILNKIDTYTILQSGLGEDGNSAIVFVELNHKTDWTYVLSNKNGMWQIRQNIAGNPKLYFEQNNSYNAIAEALGKADDAKAWDFLEAAFRNYPDSADLFYYRALYWQLVKQPDKATVDFFNAFALDNSWTEPLFHLGAIYLSKKDYAQAEMWLKELVDLQPENPNALNNLAAAYAGKGEFDSAIKLWQELVDKFPGFELAAKNLELIKDK